VKRRFDPDKHHRRSIRLKGFDYGQDGMYFVTICVWNRESLFGQIMNGEMDLSPSGEIVQAVWDDLPNHHVGLELDAFVIMPNHVHAILVGVPVWQRNYFERVIRSDSELDDTRAYILENPLYWDQDEENPNR
jgi:putative transposase